MDGLNIDRIFANLRNPELYLKKLKQDTINQGGMGFSSEYSQQKSNVQLNNPINSLIMNNQIQMNQLAGIDRAVYIKNLLGLPQALGTMLTILQTNTPLPTTNSLIQQNINNNIVQNQAVLSQIFDETSDAIPEAIQNQLLNQTAKLVRQNDAVNLIFSGMISLPAASEMIIKNSKQAINGLIIAMASASKHGMTGEQITDTLNIINNCVAMAESASPTQTLKSLMLLYLPWLPLNEGVGFDLEITKNDSENSKTDSKLTVLIKTKNYGNVKGIFTLTTSNSVDVFIVCSELFPKTLLQKALMAESSTLSVSTSIDVEVLSPKNINLNEQAETEVNLSATNELNPYLLLMAHAFIRNTISIDLNAIMN